MRALLTLAMFVLLAACGGGSADDPLIKVEACMPKKNITVQLFGDSTQLGAGASPGFKPAQLLQANLDLRFGAGEIQVIDSSVGGTTTLMALNGTNGMAMWPVGVRGDIVVVNWGVNDSTDYPVADFKDYVRRLTGVTIFETPNPIEPSMGNDDAYAQAMREVAAERRIQVADAHAAVLSMPGWQTKFSDGFHHPNDEMYAAIVANALAPAVAAQVLELLCM